MIEEDGQDGQRLLIVSDLVAPESCQRVGDLVMDQRRGDALVFQHEMDVEGSGILQTCGKGEIHEGGGQRLAHGFGGKGNEGVRLEAAAQRGREARSTLPSRSGTPRVDLKNRS